MFKSNPQTYISLSCRSSAPTIFASLSLMLWHKRQAFARSTATCLILTYLRIGNFKDDFIIHSTYFTQRGQSNNQSRSPLWNIMLSSCYMYLHLFEIALYLLKKRLFLGVFTVFVRHKTPTTDEPTEKLSSYKDKIPQPTAQQQKSYPKDATDFINLKAKKASKRSDNHFNGHYAVTHKYTPTPPPPQKKKW